MIVIMVRLCCRYNTLFWVRLYDFFKKEIPFDQQSDTALLVKEVHFDKKPFYTFNYDYNTLW